MSFTDGRESVHFVEAYNAEMFSIFVREERESENVDS